jgi:uncharacterized membrane protein
MCLDVGYVFLESVGMAHPTAMDLTDNAPGLTASTPDKRSAIYGIFAFGALILFLCSVVRHELFQSNAFDLGIFDQGVYLISQNKPPLLTFVNWHLMGDHAAWILYPIGWIFYKIYPTVYWLFLIQSVSLAFGAVMAWALAKQAALAEHWSIAIALVYLLHPQVFNANLFDFHTEVIAVPLLMGSIWFARREKPGLGRWLGFVLCLVLALGCKAVVALTVAALGLGLLLFERRRGLGAIALFLGTAWFLLATQVIMPPFIGQEAVAVDKYAYLGHSIGEIALNVFLKPGLVLGHLFTIDNLFYPLLVFGPVLWAISRPSLPALMGAVPCLALNLLVISPPQKNVVHHYSLMVLPFLVMLMISALKSHSTWLERSRWKQPKWMVIWVLILFLALSKYLFFGSRYLTKLDTWGATREAIALIQGRGPVLTQSGIAPHLSHRVEARMLEGPTFPVPIDRMDYILIDSRHPGGINTPEMAQGWIAQITQHPRFQKRYEKDGIYLFTASSLQP